MIKRPVEFKHQAVRDLAWAVSSPPLISSQSDSCVLPESNWFQQIYEQSHRWIQGIDEAPAELEELVAAQKDRRLGRYFETLWFYWLSNHPRYEIVENNVQIIIDGETLGEMDFIIFDKITGLTSHWEVAVKFYLGISDTTLMHNWHGPGLRDRLDIKVEHLLSKQSVISKDPRVLQWLKQRGIKIDSCAVILKGRLYYPWRKNMTWDSPVDGISPAQCSSDHLYSWWLNPEQFEQVFDDEQYFIPLLNSGWLERIPTASVKKRYVKKDIFETESKDKLRFPLHLTWCNPEYIRDRLFLVGFDWP